MTDCDDYAEILDELPFEQNSNDLSYEDLDVLSEDS